MRSIHARGRDNARTPMQWDGEAQAGFTEGTPWIKVNPNYVEINAQAELNDDDSIFRYYQKLIQLRKDYEVIVKGDFELFLPEDPDLFIYTRTLEETILLVVANFHEKRVSLILPEKLQLRKECLICNYKDQEEGYLRPYEAAMYMV